MQFEVLKKKKVVLRGFYLEREMIRLNHEMKNCELLKSSVKEGGDEEITLESCQNTFVRRCEDFLRKICATKSCGEGRSTIEEEWEKAAKDREFLERRNCG